MEISVTELVTVLVVYTAMAGSGLYWLWHRALTRRARATWAAAVFVMPAPALIARGVVRPGGPQRWARRPPARTISTAAAGCGRSCPADRSSARRARRARRRFRGPSPA